MATLLYTEKKDVPKHKQVKPYKIWLYVSLGSNLVMSLIILVLLLKK